MVFRVCWPVGRLAGLTVALGHDHRHVSDHDWCPPSSILADLELGNLQPHNAATAKQFAPRVDSAGHGRTRDDVWIAYLDRKGPLTVGFGARKDEIIGPEIGFGWVMGDALDEPVLLIKSTALIVPTFTVLRENEPSQVGKQS